MAYINGKEILFSANYSKIDGVAQELYDAAKARVDALEVENDIIGAENDELTIERNVLLDNMFDLLQIQNYCTIEIPEDVTKIRPYAFYYHSRLMGVKLHNKVGQILVYAFAKSSINEIDIPDSVTIIENFAFYGCASLTRVKLSKALSKVNESVFFGCTACLEYDFTACETVPTLVHTNAFGNINASAKIKVPSALLSQWKTATNWVGYADYIVGV